MLLKDEDAGVTLGEVIEVLQIGAGDRELHFGVCVSWCEGGLCKLLLSHGLQT